MKTILVIPDSHACIEESNDRYEWAGRLIVDRRPDIVIELGDFGDYESLCSHTKGTIEAEGKRLVQDMEITKDAREKLTMPLLTLQQKQRNQKIKLYNPELIALQGNHENPRWDKIVKYNPELLGIVNDDLGYARTYGWQSYPYQKIVSRCGIEFSHNFVSGSYGRPIEGEFPATSLLRKRRRSSVCGHNHKFDLAIDNDAGIYCLSAGCYFESYKHYAGQANAQWWRGLFILHNCNDGKFDVEAISIDRVRSEYSV